MRRARGSKEYMDFMNGKKLSARAAIRAKCYECSGYYMDGVSACHIKTCPLYFYNPYNGRWKVESEVLEESETV